MAIEKKACNALLLKINQIGTISESIQAYVLFLLTSPENMLTSQQRSARSV